MTTGDVVTYANLDGIKGAVSAANIQFVLRYKLVYEFLYDIGYPSWSRSFFSATLVSGNNYFDLTSPNDFRQMRKLVVYTSSTEKPELTYIGDQDEKVFDAQAETTAGQPSEFWIGFDGTTLRRVFVNRPADQNYTMRGSYYKRIPFGDDTDTGFNLNPYIPQDSQWPLVLLLQKYFYADRLGVDDPRYQAVDAEYKDWIGRIRENPEKSSGAKYAYMT